MRLGYAYLSQKDYFNASKQFRIAAKHSRNGNKTELEQLYQKLRSIERERPKFWKGKIFVHHDNSDKFREEPYKNILIAWNKKV